MAIGSTFRGKLELGDPDSHGCAGKLDGDAVQLPLAICHCIEAANTDKPANVGCVAAN